MSKVECAHSKKTNTFNKEHAEENKGNKKPKRMAGVKKGNAPNTNTAYIGGTFNVNLAKKELKKYITNTLQLDLGIINAQFPYAAIAELISLQLIRASGKYNIKSSKKADLYEVKLENVHRAVRESNEFGQEIKSLTETYVPTAINYTALFFDNENILRTYLETQSFANTNNVTIPKDTLNYVCYVLSYTLAELTRIACVMSLYAKKKNVLIRNFKYACDIYFSGSLRELLSQRLSEIELLFSNKKEDKDAEKDESAEEDNSENCDNIKSDVNAKKKVTKKSKKMKMDEDNDDESDEEDNNENCNNIKSDVSVKKKVTKKSKNIKTDEDDDEDDYNREDCERSD